MPFETAQITGGKSPDIQISIYPAVAQITWTWEDEEGIVQDYEHFSIPFILTVDKVLGKIRNKTMRELPGGTLFPDTMKQYDEYTIREALHNAIAHQDYTLQQRIVFVEGPSTLYYGNGGSFIPGTIENALEHKGPQFHYRNECLCRGMVNFNMIDTVGRGIRKIYTEQRNRFFPMPDYDIDNEHRTVGVRSFLRSLRSFLRSLRSFSAIFGRFKSFFRSFFTSDSSDKIVMTFYLKSHLLISSATSHPIHRRSHHRSRYCNAPAPPMIIVFILVTSPTKAWRTATAT